MCFAQNSCCNRCCFGCRWRSGCGCTGTARNSVSSADSCGCGSDVWAQAMALAEAAERGESCNGCNGCNSCNSCNS